MTDFYSSLDWNMGLFLIHLAGTVMTFMLYRRAPCWIQKIVVAMIAIGMGILTAAYLLAVFDVEYWSHVVVAGLAVNHIAVMLYVFRIIWQGGLERGTNNQPSSASG